MSLTLPLLLALQAPPPPPVVPPPPPSAPAPATTAATESAKLRMLVLEPTSNAVDKGTLETIASLISVEAAKDPRFDVMSSAEVTKMAALEADKQSAGCDSSGCLAELAGAMGARLVVFGDAGRLGSLTIVNLSLFDAEKASSVSRVSVQAAALEELPPKLSSAVRALVAPIARGGGDQQAMAVTTPAPEPSSGSAVGAIVWGVSFVGVGALTALGAALWDGLSLTSYNDEIDGGDFVGPGCGALGVAGIVIGLFANPFASSDDDAGAPAAAAGGGGR